MPVNFLNFSESSTPINTDYVVGFANSNKGGERRWSYDVIKSNILSNVSKTTAKAWVNFNGLTSPGTIRSSYNVSSITKIGVGKYTVNLAAGVLQNSNYCVVMSSSYDSTGTGWLAFQDNRLGGKSQSQFFIASTDGSVYRDSTAMYVAFFEG